MIWSKNAFAVKVGLSLTAFLIACGGDNDGSSSASPKQDFVSSVDKLGECIEDFEGDTVFVKDKKVDYICSDGKWLPVEESSGNAKPDVVTIKDIVISGVTQKGPFVNGSSITVQELDGKTLAQTGKSFKGKISNDKGEFSVSSVSLASQYAILEASGYFRNEVTGEKSSSTITLNAITDLSNRKNVNVNLLTHLEYDRVLNLVNSELDVATAKEQAETEILNTFNIKGDFASSEDLDIFNKGDGNAALLAFSVLMLRDLSEADLTEFLTKFATDIEKDGIWDDEDSKASIADWAQAKDLSGELATIRSNIEKWNLGTVPGFEKFVRNFWYTNYGLGECGKSNMAKVLAVKNERSSKYGTQARYICKEGAWIEASDFEKDTYQWEAGDDGEIRTGDVTQTKKYDYDSKLKKWREASAIEAALGGCTESRESNINKNTGKVNGSWYICKDRTWESTEDITVDTQGWIKGKDGDLRKGDSTEIIYKFDEIQNKWLTATKNDSTLKLRGCTINRTGEIGKSSIDNTDYVCKDMDWQTALEIDYDTYGEKCSGKEVGKTIDGVVTATNKYYCMANGWKSLMNGWSWDFPKESRLNLKITYGAMTDTRDKKIYKTVKIGEQVWMAENLNYDDSITTPSIKGRSWCNDNKAEYCDVTGRLYTWAAAIDSVKLHKEKSIDCGSGKTCSLPDTVYGICPPGWHLPDTTEWNVLFDKVGGKSTASMILKSQSGWNSSGNGTDDYGFSALPAGSKTDVGNFEKGGLSAYFWSSAECEDQNAYYMYLFYNRDGTGLGNYYKFLGLSVRCLQDSEN